MFGHAHLVKPLGHRLCKDMQVGVFRQIGGQADNPVVRAGRFDQRMAEGGRDAVIAFGLQRGDHGGGGDPRAVIAGHEPPLEQVGAYADGVGPYKQLLWAQPGLPSDFIERAHAFGLVVHPWTFRDDNLPEHYTSSEAEIAAHLEIGVDGVFTDFPETVAKLRRDGNKE